MTEVYDTRSGHGEIYLPEDEDGMTGEPFVDGLVAWMRETLGQTATKSSAGNGSPLSDGTQDAVVESQPSKPALKESRTNANYTFK